MGDKIFSIEFYKSELLKDLVKGNGELIKQGFMKKQGEMVKKLLSSNPMFKRLLENQEEVYNV